MAAIFRLALQGSDFTHYGFDETDWRCRPWRGSVFLLQVPSASRWA